MKFTSHQEEAFSSSGMAAASIQIANGYLVSLLVTEQRAGVAKLAKVVCRSVTSKFSIPGYDIPERYKRHWLLDGNLAMLYNISQLSSQIG